jgi:hypothetical protein
MSLNSSFFCVVVMLRSWFMLCLETLGAVTAVQMTLAGLALALALPYVLNVQVFTGMY